MKRCSGSGHGCVHGSTTTRPAARSSVVWPSPRRSGRRSAGTLPSSGEAPVWTRPPRSPTGDRRAHLARTRIPAGRPGCLRLRTPRDRAARRQHRTSEPPPALAAGRPGRLVVAALVAGLLAFQARDRAERSEVSAEARRLAADALNEDYPDLGLLSVLEAILLEPGPDTYGALLTLLARDSGVVRGSGRRTASSASPRRRTDGPSTSPRTSGRCPPSMPSPASAGGRCQGRHSGPTPSALRLTAPRSSCWAAAIRSGAASRRGPGRTLWDLDREAIESAQGGGSTWLGDGVGWAPDGSAVFATATHVLFVRGRGTRSVRAVPWPQVAVRGRVGRVAPRADQR